MKAPTVTVLVTDAGHDGTPGESIASDGTCRSFNGGVRRSEAIVREYARTVGVLFEGDQPYVEKQPNGKEYRRFWQAVDGSGALNVLVEVVLGA